MHVSPEILLKGIIAWMREEGVAPTRTRLIKFLYLADLQHARYNRGCTFTNWRWYVDSFGPFATEAIHLLDSGVKKGWLKTVVLQRETQLADATLESDAVKANSSAAFVYDLVDYESVDRAKEEMPVGFGMVRNWIKKYGSDTNSLLRFVYGNTEPMDNALEGQILDFTTARPIAVAKPIPSRKLTRQERSKLDDLLSKMRAKYHRILEQNEAMNFAPYDDAYYEGLPREIETPSGTVVLRFPNAKNGG
jgi:hypothetical protein